MSTQEEEDPWFAMGAASGHKAVPVSSATAADEKDEADTAASNPTDSMTKPKKKENVTFEEPEKEELAATTSGAVLTTELLNARAAERRIISRRQRMEATSPSTAKLYVMDTWTTVIVFCCIAGAVAGPHWPLLLVTAAMMIAPSKIIPPPSERKITVPEASDDTSGSHPAPDSSAPADAADGSARPPRQKKAKLIMDVGFLANGRDASAFHVAGRGQLLAALAYCLLFVVGLIVFQIVYASSDAVRNHYAAAVGRESPDNVTAAVIANAPSWHSALIGSADIDDEVNLIDVYRVPPFVVNYYWMFGMIPATEEPFRFALALLPPLGIALLALTLLPLVPKRYIYYHGRGADPAEIAKAEADPKLWTKDLVDLHPGSRQPEEPVRGEPRLVYASVTLLFVMVGLASVILPNYAAVMPLVAVLLMIGTTILSRPDASQAIPPAAFAGDDSTRQIFFPTYVFGTDCNGTFLRSICITVIHYFSALAIIAMVTFQNPTFEGWNGYHDDLASRTGDASYANVSLAREYAAWTGPGGRKVKLNDFSAAIASHANALVAADIAASNVSTNNTAALVSVKFASLMGAIGSSDDTFLVLPRVLAYQVPQQSSTQPTNGSSTTSVITTVRSDALANDLGRRVYTENLESPWYHRAGLHNVKHYYFDASLGDREFVTGDIAMNSSIVEALAVFGNPIVAIPASLSPQLLRNADVATRALVQLVVLFFVWLLSRKTPASIYNVSVRYPKREEAHKALYRTFKKNQPRRKKTAKAAMLSILGSSSADASPNSPNGEEDDDGVEDDHHSDDSDISVDSASHHVHKSMVEPSPQRETEKTSSGQEADDKKKSEKKKKKKKEKGKLARFRSWVGKQFSALYRFLFAKSPYMTPVVLVVFIAASPTAFSAILLVPAAFFFTLADSKLMSRLSAALYSVLALYTVALFVVYAGELWDFDAVGRGRAFKLLFFGEQRQLTELTVGDVNFQLAALLLCVGLLNTSRMLQLMTSRRRKSEAAELQREIDRNRQAEAEAANEPYAPATPTQDDTAPSVVTGDEPSPAVESERKALVALIGRSFALRAASRVLGAHEIRELTRAYTSAVDQEAAHSKSQFLEGMSFMEASLRSENIPNYGEVENGAAEAPELMSLETQTSFVSGDEAGLDDKDETLLATLKRIVLRCCSVGTDCATPAHAYEGIHQALRLQVFPQCASIASVLTPDEYCLVAGHIAHLCPAISDEHHSLVSRGLRNGVPSTGVKQETEEWYDYAPQPTDTWAKQAALPKGITLGGVVLLLDRPLSDAILTCAAFRDGGAGLREAASLASRMFDTKLPIRSLWEEIFTLTGACLESLQPGSDDADPTTDLSMTTNDSFFFATLRDVSFLYAAEEEPESPLNAKGEGEAEGQPRKRNNSSSFVPEISQSAANQAIATEKADSGAPLKDRIVLFFRRLRRNILNAIRTFRMLLFRLLVVDLWLVAGVFFCVSCYRKNMTIVNAVLVFCCALTCWMVCGSIHARRKWMGLCTIISMLLTGLVFTTAVLNDEIAGSDSAKELVGVAGFEASYWEVCLYFLLYFTAIIQHGRLEFQEERLDVRRDLLRKLRDRFGMVPAPATGPSGPNDGLEARQHADTVLTEPHESTAGLTAMRNCHLCGDPKDYLSWDELRSEIEWRLLRGSDFFIKLQMYGTLLVAAPIFLFLENFTASNYIVGIFLLLFILLSCVSTVHPSSFHAAVMYRLWFIVAGFGTAAFLMIGLYQIPEVKESISDNLVESFNTTNGKAFMERCDLYSEIRRRETAAIEAATAAIVLGNATNTTIPVATLGSDLDSRALSCLKEVGLAHDDTVTALGAMAPWFVVMFVGVMQFVALRNFYVRCQRALMDALALRSLVVGGASQAAADDEQQDETDEGGLVSSSGGPSDASQKAGGAAASTVAASATESQFRIAVATVLYAIGQHVPQVSWIVLFLAATLQRSVTTAPYLIFFAMDWRGTIPLVYSAVHLVLLYCFPLAFFPRYWDDRGMSYIGVAKDTTEQSIRDVLLGPALVFLCSQLHANTTAERHTDTLPFTNPLPKLYARIARFKAQPPKRVTDKLRYLGLRIAELLAFLYLKGFSQFGYEVYLLVLLISMVHNPITLTLMLYVGAFIAAVKIDRYGFITSRKVIRLTMLAFTIVLLVTYWFAVRTPDPDNVPGFSPIMAPSEEDRINSVGREDHKYSFVKWVGGYPSGELLWSLFAVIAVLRMVLRHVEENQNDPEEVFTVGGSQYTSFAEVLKDFSEEIGLAQRKRCDVNFIVPTSSSQPELKTVDRLRKPQTLADSFLLLYAFAFVAPILIFADGLTEVSVLHVALIAIGLWSFRFRVRVFWGTFFFWPKIIAIQCGILVVTAIVNIPPIAELFVRFPEAPRAIGLTSNAGTEAMAVTSWRVAAIWFTLLTWRLFRHFSFMGFMLNLHQQTLDAAVMHDTLIVVMQEREAKEDESAKEKEQQHAAVLHELKNDMEANSGAAGPGYIPATPSGMEDIAATPMMPDASLSASDLTAIAEQKPEEEKKEPPSPLDQAKEMLAKVVKMYIKFMYSRTYFGKKTIAGCSTTAEKIAAATWGFVLRHTADLCYLVLSINFIANGTVYDAIPSVAVLAFGAVWYPWPPRAFWHTMISYIAVGVCIKAFVRFIAEQSDISPSSSSSLAIFLVNLEKHEGVQRSAGGLDLVVVDMALDFLSMFVLLWHLRVCDMHGVYFESSTEDRGPEKDESESDDDSIATELETDSEDERLMALLEENDDKETTGAGTTGEPSSADRPPDAAAVPVAEGKDGDETTEEESAVSKILKNITRVSGCGRDNYTLTFLLELGCLFYSMFAYFSLAGRASGSLQQSIEQNLLPGPLVVMLLLLVLIMVVDRILYTLSASKSSLAALVKAGFHLLLMLFYHITYIVWIADVATSAAGGGTLMMAKAIYGMLAAHQLKLGYPLFRHHDPFTRSAHWIMEMIYIIYRIIPFLWDLRVMLDWACTRTSLNFYSYLKIEDVGHEVYKRYARRVYQEVTNPKKGLAHPLAEKLTNGVAMFTVIMFIMFFPLMYYSAFNPNTRANYVTSASATLTVSGQELFSSTQGSSTVPVDDDFQLYLRSTHPSAAEDEFLTELRDLQVIELNRCSNSLWSASPTLRSGLLTRLDVLAKGDSSFATNPKTAVDVELAMELDRSVVVGEAGAAANGVQFKSSLQPAQARRLHDELNTSLYLTAADLIANGSSITSGPIPLEGLYEPMLFSVPSGFAKYSEQAKKSATSRSVNCQLRLTSEIDSSTGTSFIVRYFCMSCQALFSKGNGPVDSSYDEFSCNANPDCLKATYNYDNAQGASAQQYREDEAAPLYLTLASDRVPSDINIIPVDIGIVALYTTFIFALGGVIRGGLTGMAHRIVLEDTADPRCLAELIAYIYLARGGGSASSQSDLSLEETLYLQLLDLLRSPELLLRRSGRQSDTTYSATDGDIIKMKPMLTW